MGKMQPRQCPPKYGGTDLLKPHNLPDSVPSCSLLPTLRCKFKSQQTSLLPGNIGYLAVFATTGGVHTAFCMLKPEVHS